MTQFDLTTTGAAPTATEPTKTKAEIASEAQVKAAADAALLRTKYVKEQEAAVAKAAHDATVARAKATIAAAEATIATGETSSAPVEKYCATCGLGSHRLDWQKTTGPVYCDNHVPGKEPAKPLSATGLKQTDTGIKLTSPTTVPDQPVAGAPTTRPSPTPVTPGPPTNVADKAALPHESEKP